jgi:hypothetical protein
MNIENTNNIVPDGNIVMILYGRGGVGKTTFAATADKPLIIDFENGTKFLGERGLKCDVIRMAEWFTQEDKKQLKELLPKYKTIVLDPIGDAMEKLIASHGLDSRKYRASDGGLTMAGWGEAKRQMKELIKWLRDAGKNVILIAHVAEGKEGEQTTYRIQIQTKLSDELPTMVDIISYMGVQKKDGKMSVCLYTPAQGGNFDSKDRTGRVPELVTVSEKNGWHDFLSSFTAVENKTAKVEQMEPSQSEQTQPANKVNPQALKQGTKPVMQNGKVAENDSNEWKEASELKSLLRDSEYPDQKKVFSNNEACIYSGRAQKGEKRADLIDELHAIMEERLKKWEADHKKVTA